MNNMQKKCLEDMLKSRKNFNENQHKKKEISMQEKLERESELNRKIQKIQEEIE